MPPEHPSSRDASVEEVFERVRAISRENERILADLVAGERRFRKLAKGVWRVQEDERRRLARELHDGIGQTLTALKNHLTWMHQNTEVDDEQSDGLAQAVELASEALDDTRELSRLLRPPVLDDLGLAPALRWLGRSVGKRFALEVSVDADDLDERLSPEVETVIFRIAQEALTNAVKHAEAATATLKMAFAEGWITLDVHDDGRGFDVGATLEKVDDRTGVGLRGMRDRVELFGGTLDIQSSSQDGTAVRARVPLSLAGPDR